MKPKTNPNNSTPKFIEYFVTDNAEYGEAPSCEGCGIIDPAVIAHLTQQPHNNEQKGLSICHQKPSQQTKLSDSSITSTPRKETAEQQTKPSGTD